MYYDAAKPTSDEAWQIDVSNRSFVLLFWKLTSVW